MSPALLVPENKPVEYFSGSDLAPNSPPETWEPSSRNLAVAPSFLVLGGPCDPSLGVEVAPNMAVAVVVVGVPPNREVAVTAEDGEPPKMEDASEEDEPPNNDAEEAVNGGAVNKDPDVFVVCEDTPNKGVAGVVDG